MAARGGSGAARRRGRGWWEELPLDELLDVRISDLALEIEGTALGARVRRLHDELGRAGLRWRPYVWLSSDWFAPDGSTGFAIPFFLAHPRLVRLERREMLEVEGGTHSWCMKLLRHEAAHALDNAYRLHARRRWRETFGRFSQPYRESYRPNPRSKRYVLNLDYWYSQSHPAEDFAETFAVWLAPGSRWRRRYAGWPALSKLEYVDELMREIADRPPALKTRSRTEPLSSLRYTLREYYRRKREHYAVDVPSGYDEHLKQIFEPAERISKRDSAELFLRRSRRELVRRVSSVTGQHPYLIDQVLNEMIPRSRKLSLRLSRPETDALLDTAILLAIFTMSFLHGGHPRYTR